MARILFVENRGKTALWQAVAHDLRLRGHEIAWLVQNPAYRPAKGKSAGAVHTLSFPPPREFHDTVWGDGWVTANFPQLTGDRGRNHFHGNCGHYAHYHEEIGRALRRIEPDVVIGEPTLFHEVLTAGLCRDMGIPYLHPVGTRYLGGRFSVFGYDTQHPLGSSGERLPDDEARELAEQIGGNRVVPSYMARRRGLDRYLMTAKLLRAQATVWLGYLRGERYNTPSLARKRQLQARLRRNIVRWESLQRLPPNPTRAILCPLQMQPEANLDVWGRGHSDQVATVTQMLAAAPIDVQVVVKANPKSKYEMSDALLDLAAANPRVCLLPLELTMPAAQRLTVGSLTVTGTVGLEAVFGKGRALSLCHPVLEAHFPAFHAPSVEDGVRRLLDDQKAGAGDVEQGIELLQTIMDQSFPGLINEPLFDARCIAPENVKRVAGVLHGIITYAPTGAISR